MYGSIGHIKTYNKASAFHKHGYNYGHMMTENTRMNRERGRFRHVPEMYGTVREAFEAGKKKR